MDNASLDVQTSPLLDAPQIPETSEGGTWSTPGFQVIETALEVTAYALGDR